MMQNFKMYKNILLCILGIYFYICGYLSCYIKIPHELRQVIKEFNNAEKSCILAISTGPNRTNPDSSAFRWQNNNVCIISIEDEKVFNRTCKLMNAIPVSVGFEFQDILTKK